ncbi:MAG TPA: hypothetical protein VK420_12715 [Longimicrobium sp.]|nr:hypothetical protein [Longimicrobium sp.]
MDQNNSANQGNEDTRAAEAHTQNAHENVEALRDQNRRTEATAGDSANHPVGQQNSGGSGTGGGTTSTGARTAGNTGTVSEDTSQASANVANAQDNRDALAEQNRRTEETTPDAVRHPIGSQDNNQR